MLLKKEIRNLLEEAYIKEECVNIEINTPSNNITPINSNDEDIEIEEIFENNNEFKTGFILEFTETGLILYTVVKEIIGKEEEIRTKGFKQNISYDEIKRVYFPAPISIEDIEIYNKHFINFNIKKQLNKKIKINKNKKIKKMFKYKEKGIIQNILNSNGIENE